MIDMQSSHKYYNFEINQIGSEIKGSFCLFYNKKEIAAYDGIVPLEEIKKSQITFNIDYYHPIDFLHFCIDFINFRTNMSVLFFKYPFEKKQGFFFDFSVFDEYCAQILELTINGMKDIENKFSIWDKFSIDIDGSLESIHRKAFSLIDKLYLSQKSFSTNSTLNSRIHNVVLYYPKFGMDYEIMKNELNLFSEKNDCLKMNKAMATKEDWAQFFGNLRTNGEWVPIETLFNIKQMKQSCHNANERDSNKKLIEKKIIEIYQNLP